MLEFAARVKILCIVIRDQNKAELDNGVLPLHDEEEKKKK